MKSFNHQSSTVYQQSLAISDLGRAIASYFSVDLNPQQLTRSSGLRSEIAFSLHHDALLIPKTIDNAVKSDSREYRLKQMTFLNTILKNILSYCNGLERDGVKEREYVNLLRSEIKLFRKSFKTWRRSFYSK